MKPTTLMRLGVVFGLCLAAARATTINFEAQGAAAPAAFDNKLNSPLVIGIATFTGGELLRNEAAAVDLTAVYATANGAPYADPLTITFSQAVSNVSLLLTNETPDTYTLADNLGHSNSTAVNANTGQTLSLVDSGVTQMTIASAIPFGWDFAIDNVSFTPSNAAV
ncbi:MAG: hypothetical protein JO211_01630, partial [Acidobacteriaceae bacterium]|nr:hypothetical protein [Acidobacteriaceae bacterium]